ncbi:hypothetical protein BDV96DRAFT_600175 [Lophiotrema nucula]|uniref:Macro domain-containing protein n=1 Tax=Lophiotrema nucula TaxID=690887 RepID=A0A6A5Z7K5_9PLEO|nr:hypothetical protein BDV96DRAFT_600175 [Lophiotrema nucula]
MTSIRLNTAANIRSFQTLSGLLKTTDSQLKYQIDGEGLEDEFGRFRVWSGNLGALQKGHSSLDYRLRDSPLLFSNALKLLKELENNINEAIAVLQGSRLPYEQQTKVGATDEEDDDFFSEDEEDDESEADMPKTELGQRFGEIVDIIDNLYKLSVRIRTPTIKTRSLKAASYRPKDPETGVDLLDQYANLDLQHTKELLRNFRLPLMAVPQDDDDWLVGRLSKAITLRRRQFKYWRRHRDKLGLSTLREDFPENVPVTPDRPELHPRQDTLEAQPSTPINVPDFREAPSQRTGKTMLSGTEATQHHQSLDEIIDSKSVTSYATTVHDLTGRGVELPSPPKAADGDKDFECPYCFIICPARYGKGRPWRTYSPIYVHIPTVKAASNCFAVVENGRSTKLDMEGGLQNHLANHLERLAAFALPKDIDTADDESGGGSSAASQGTSQDLSDVSFLSDSDAEVVQGPLQESTTFSKAHETENIGPTVSLSAATLDALPDATQSRLNILLPNQIQRPDDSASLESEDSNIEEAEDITDELPSEIQSLRSHLLSLEGSVSARFLRRRVFWRGYVSFRDEGSATTGLETFDQSRFPDVSIRSGVQDKASLEFSLPMHIGLNPSHSAPKEEDDSLSSMSLSYDDEPERGSTMPVLPVVEIPTLRSLYRSRKLQQRDQSYAPNDAYNQTISFTFYDIARLRVGAIVNSANKAMKITRSNDSLNHYIHKVAGPGLKRECKSIGRARVGQVRMTSGYNLPCTYVLHAARPQYSSSIQGMGRFNELTECYREALRTARENNIRTLAFPCLGAGGCGFPSRVAARIALQEVREFLDVYKNNPFERIIFCVFNGTDEQAYKDFLPVYFPPTHGDLENIAPLESVRDPATLATQLMETYNQIDSIARGLAEFSDNIQGFPQTIFNELAAVGSTLRALADLFGRPQDALTKYTSQNIVDIDLICSVLQGACAGLIEIIEQTKYSAKSDQPNHKTIWDDYNFHMKNSQGLDVPALLELCQDFIQCLEDILARDGVELHEMGTMRVRLGSFRLKQTGESHKDVEDKFAEVMYTREFQRNAVTPSRTDAIKVHQIPSISRLYQLNELGSRPTNAIPNSRFNNIVCLFREDITRLEVDVIASSTDMGFTGMGTLDRTVFRKAGLAMQEDCANFGVCKEGDVRITAGYSLPCKHVIHTIPPETYRSNTKDVLRKIYRELLFTASSLKATSLAIPTLGTGMLNYPKRDCASLALEEVKRFLETSDPSSPLEKIIFCVFGSNDEFIYKSLLPTFFPPVDLNVNKALPSEWRHNSRTYGANSADTAVETPSPPRRTIFHSIGEAFLNVRFGKQPATPASRPLNAGEEHALIGFESHAQGCGTCSNIAKLYAEGQDLCAEGYGEAQSVLQYLYMEADRSVYPMNAEGGNRVKVEIPEEYPLSWNLLVTVEKSFRDTDRQRPFVSRSEPYAIRAKEKQGQAPRVSFAPNAQHPPRDDPAEKATAFVFAWSESRNDWESILPYECSVFIFPGRLDVFEVDYGTDRQIPLLSLELTDMVSIEKEVSTQIIVTAINLQEPRERSMKRYMFRSQSPPGCEMLFQRVKHARTTVPQPPPRRNPGTASAHVFYKPKPDVDFHPLYVSECLIHIYLGRLEVYEHEHAQSHSGPLVALELSPDVEIEKSEVDIILQARILPESRVEVHSEVLFRSKDFEDCTTLHEFIMWGSANNPTHLAKQNVLSPKRPRGEGKVVEPPETTEADSTLRLGGDDRPTPTVPLGAESGASASSRIHSRDQYLPAPGEEPEDFRSPYPSVARPSIRDDHLPVGSFMERLEAITASVSRDQHTSPFCHFVFKPGTLEIYEKTVPKLADAPLYRLSLTPTMEFNRISETKIEINVPPKKPDGTVSSSGESLYVLRFQHLGDCSLLLQGLVRFRLPDPRSDQRAESITHPTSIVASVQRWDKLGLWTPTGGVECRITLSSGKLEVDAGAANVDAQPSSFRLELRLDPSASFFHDRDTVVNLRAYPFLESEIGNPRHRLKIRTKDLEDCNLLLKRLEQHCLWPEDERPLASIQNAPESGPEPDVGIKVDRPPHLHSLQGPKVQAPDVQQPGHNQTTPSKLDLAISGLGAINVDDFFSYLDLAAVSSVYTDTEPTWRRQPNSQNPPAPLKRSLSLPGDHSSGPSSSTNVPPVHNPPSNPESEDEQDSEDDGVRHPRPTTPDTTQDKPIPSGARWTKINRRIVNPQALEEAKERFEEREDCVIVLRVLRKDEIVRLAERTREIRMGKEEEGGEGDG